MKQVKRKAIATALALGIAAGTIPANVVFAAESSYSAQLIAEVTSNGTPIDGGSLIKPGDIVTVTFYLEGAGWAQMDKATGLASFDFGFAYDNSLLSYRENSATYSQLLADVFGQLKSGSNYHNNAEKGTFKFVVMEDSLEKEVTFASNDKTELLHLEFEVKGTPETEMEGDLDFTLNATSSNFIFGDADSANLETVSATITTKVDNQVDVDTKKPVIALDGTQDTKFFYRPISVTVSDKSGVASVVFNGKDLTAPYTITESGELVVTDKAGNKTTLSVTVDAAAFENAQAAIAALPETVTFQNKSLVDAAQAAVDAVTNETAKNKLDLEKLAKAVEAAKALEAQRQELVQAIANSNLAITLNAQDRQAIADLRSKVTAMQELGATFTETELKKLVDAETALKALEARSEKTHQAIAALPTAQDTVLGDAAKLNALKQEKEELVALGDTFTEEELAKIAAVEQGLQEIAELKTQTEKDIEEILAVPDVSPALATQVNAVNTKLETLTQKGVDVSSISNYEEFLKLAESVQGMLDRIEKVTKLIEALPSADSIGFGDEEQIAAAEQALKELQAEQLDVAPETAKSLEDARKTLEALKTQRADLVQEIAGSKFAITLKAEDAQAITGLRSKVDALANKGANFTQAELKKLVEAETALKALETRSEKAHQAIAALPTAQDTVLADAAKLDALKQEKEALIALGDTFTEEELAKIAAVEQGLQDIADLKAQVEYNIQAVLDVEKVFPALATQVNAINASLATLQAKGVATGDIAGYEEFQQVVQAVQEMLNRIEAVTKLIEAIPSPDRIGFGDEEKIAAAEQALAELRADELDVTIECAQLLLNARQALENLKVQRIELVQEIFGSKLNVTLATEDVQAITALRAKVNALANKGAAFTDAEMENLLNAETALKDLQERSKKAHQAVAALPSAQDVRWTMKDSFYELLDQVNQLIVLGDSYTQKEYEKLTNVSNTLVSIGQQADDLRAVLEKLPTTADEHSASVLSALNKQISQLKAVGYAVNSTTMGTTAMQRYEAFVKAVADYQNSSNNTGNGSSDNNNNNTGGNTGGNNGSSTDNNGGSADNTGNNGGSTGGNAVTTPSATKAPSSAVIKKPSASSSAQSTEKPEATSTPEATQKPEATKEPTSSAPQQDASSSQEQAQSTQGNSLLSNVLTMVLGTVAAVGAIAGAVLYFFTKKRGE